MKKIIFWGAGDLGIKALQVLSKYNIQPDFFIDSKKVGFIDDIRICLPCAVSDLIITNHEVYVYITASQEAPIREAVLNLGVSDEFIIPLSSETKILMYAMLLEETKNIKNKCDISGEYNVVFDFSNGLALGGVETWALQCSKCISNSYLIKSFFLSPRNQISQIEVDESQVTYFELGDNLLDKRQNIISELLKYLPMVFVLNFPGIMPASIAYLKKIYPQYIKVIAVIHNDNIEYYRDYSAIKEYIDQVWYISNWCKNKAIEYGISNEKLKFLPWNIRQSNCEKRYSSADEPIRIGYAGRIDLYQKRWDRIVKLILELNKRSINFELNIAGIGEYWSKAKQHLIEENVYKNVNYYGVVPHDKIYNFFNEQDIVISCSQYEGHSISQCEAMACGAVPVLSRVSGVEDDVEDGVNGYVIDFNDEDKGILSMADIIIGLYLDRTKLELLGNKAKTTINKNYNEDSVRKLWESFLDSM